MDNLKLDAIGLRKCTLFRIVTNLEWTKMAGITVRGVDRCLRELNRRSKFDPTSTAVQG